MYIFVDILKYSKLNEVKWNGRFVAQVALKTIFIGIHEIVTVTRMKNVNVMSASVAFLTIALTTPSLNFLKVTNLNYQTNSILNLDTKTEILGIILIGPRCGEEEEDDLVVQSINRFINL